MYSSLCTGWLNYVLPASVLGPLPLLFLVQENYNRLNIDEGKNYKNDSIYFIYLNKD